MGTDITLIVSGQKLNLYMEDFTEVLDLIEKIYVAASECDNGSFSIIITPAGGDADA